MDRAVIAVLAHEWRQVRAGASGTIVALLFLFAVVTSAAFAIGADLPRLARTGPAILWIAALLAGLLGFERTFASDAEDGTLDVVLTSGTDPLAYAAAKVIARFLFGLVPLVLAVPFAGLLLSMPASAIIGATITLAIGSPALAAISSLGAALAVSTRGSSLLGPVVTLPLLVPVVIFGSAAADRWSTAAATTPLLLLAAITIVTAVVVPVAIAALLTAND